MAVSCEADTQFRVGTPTFRNHRTWAVAYAPLARVRFRRPQLGLLDDRSAGLGFRQYRHAINIIVTIVSMRCQA